MIGDHRARPTPPGAQPQRTTLAWTRTVIGCGALTAVVARHAMTSHRGVELVAAAVCLVATFGVFVLGRRRRGQIARSIAAGRNPVVPRGVLLVSVLVALSGLAVVGMLLT
jgi:hypothetical protein